MKQSETAQLARKLNMNFKQFFPDMQGRNGLLEVHMSIIRQLPWTNQKHIILTIIRETTAYYATRLTTSQSNS
jgi:hypothetical protein